MLPTLISTCLLVSWASAAAIHHSTWFRNVVVFGDSYSDVRDPVISASAAWPTYFASFSGIENVTSLARRGSRCVDVQSEQLAQHLADPPPSPEETLYIIFTGMEDVRRLVSEPPSQNPWRAKLDVSCPVEIMDTLTSTVDAKNFIWVNLIPFEMNPLSSASEFARRVAPQIQQLVTAGNAMTTDFVGAFVAENPEVRAGVLNLHALFTDMHADRTASLSTGALNGGSVKSIRRHVSQRERSPIWHDAFHPSEQTNRAIAQAISDSLSGEDTRWVTWIRRDSRESSEGFRQFVIIVSTAGVVAGLLMVVGL